MAQKPSIPSGTRDFLPEVMLRREFIFQTIRQVFRKYGYMPIQTPAMENLSVLTGKYGEEGDRLIFKILNNGDFMSKAKHPEDSNKLAYEISSRALRFDLTVPFARFVVMHQNELTFPFKRYQIQPVWRADRPARGRYREFFQCDADVVGSDSLIYEAEFVSIFDEVLHNLHLPGFSILLNNRKILSGYAEALGRPEKFQDICVAIDKMDKIGVDGVRQELGKRGIDSGETDRLFEILHVSGSNLEKLDKLETLFANSEDGKKGIAEMRELLSYLEHMEIRTGEVVFDLSLARGLDYYTGTIYEVRAHGVNMGSICGGGRYADLTGVFGRPGLSGVGISFGADRLYDVMDELGLFDKLEESSVRVMLVNFGTETLAESLRVMTALRDSGIPAELYPDAAKMKKQFGYADKKNIPFALMIGEEEIKSGKYKLKDMRSGEQQNLDLSGVIAHVWAPEH